MTGALYFLGWIMAAIAWLAITGQAFNFWSIPFSTMQVFILAWLAVTMILLHARD